MAGIGFRLQRILDKPSFASIARAYAYAALISSGPLILSIFSLAMLGVAVQALPQDQDITLFFASVTTIYSFTMILASPIQLVMVRSVADADYAEKRGLIWALLVKSIGWVAPVTLFAGGGFFWFGIEAAPVFRLAAVFLCVLVGMLWLLAGYLTALKNYNRVVLCFAGGYLSCLGLGWLAVRVGGMDWIMLGFALGHLVMVLLLMVCIRIETPATDPELVGEASIGGALRRYPDLAGCALAYTLGIWIDKFLFWWFGEGNQQVNGWLFAMPLHDQAVYLGFLSIIPGMAIFLLRLETEFATHYAAFYRAIGQKAPLETLRRERKAMMTALRDEVLALVKYQGAVTLVLLVMAPKLMPMLGVGALQTGVFQVVLLGSLLLIVFLSFLTVLFYLDKRLAALKCCVLFAVINGVVTGVSILTGEQWYGVGYVAATALALAAAATMVSRHLGELEYETFTSQPMFPTAAR
jgi:uncharacterized membrane protein